MPLEGSASTYPLVEKALPLHLLEYVFTGCFDMPCYLVMVEDRDFWYSIANTRAKASPMDFESAGMGWQARRDYNDSTFRKVAALKKPLCVAHRGLYGLFVPVLKRGRCVAILQCGVFLREAPTERRLAEQWRVMRGRAARADDIEFGEYVRSMVEVPVLDPDTLAALTQFLELYADVLVEAPGWERSIRAMDRLREAVFRRKSWNRRWADTFLSWKRLRHPPDHQGRLPKLIKQELGIGRFPTTVLAAMQEDAGQAWTSSLSAVSFQQAAFECAKEMEETIACTLSSYGVLLLTSAGPDGSPDQAREEIRKKAEWFARSLSRRIEGRVRVGIGGSTRQWGGLQDSYQQALAALHGAASNHLVVAFYGDLPKTSMGITELRRMGAGIAKRILEQGRLGFGRQQRGLIQRVLAGTRGRVDGTRRVFQDIVGRLFEAVEGRNAMDPEALAQMEAEVDARLEQALDVNELAGRFEVVLASLSEVLERPAVGEKASRIKQAREAIASSPESDWALPGISAQFGFSAATFSKEFGRLVGMPFSRFLFLRRIEKSKRLLLEGSLTLELVATQSGFRSKNYFSQVFKRETGVSPGQYRSKASQEHQEN